jgi:hypothetical protein
MAVRFINPIKSTPISAYVPLPTELMAQNLQQNQERFDYAEAGIRALDDVFKSGYASSDLEKALREEYDPQIQELAETLYSTGNAGYITPAIAEMNKKFSADPRYRTALEDFQYKAMVDKQLQERPNDIFNNAIYDAEGNITGWKPIATGQSLGAYYRTTPFANVVEEIMKVSTSQLKASLENRGIKYVTGPDGNLIMTEEVVKFLNEDNEFTRSAKKSIIDAMIANPDQYPAVRYEKARAAALGNPDSWKQRIADIVDAQFRQLYFREQHNQNQGTSDNNRKPGGNIPDNTDSVVSIPNSFTQEATNFPLIKQTYEDSKNTFESNRKEVLGSALSSIPSLNSNSNPVDIDFAKASIVNFATLIEEYRDSIPQDLVSRMGNAAKKFFEGQYHGKNLKQIFTATTFAEDPNEDKEYKAIFENLIIQSLSDTFEQTPAFGELAWASNLYGTINKYNNSFNDLLETESNYNDFYLNEQNFGTLFKDNPQLIPEFEAKIKDGKLPKFEDWFKRGKSQAYLTYGEELNPNGVPIRLIEAWKKEHEEENRKHGLSEEENPLRILVHPKRNLSLDELRGEDLNNLGSKVPKNYKAHVEQHYDYLKNYYERKRSQIEDTNDRTIDENGVRLVSGDTPSNNMKVLYTAVESEVLNSRQFEFYNSRNPLGKGQLGTLKDGERAILVSGGIELTPSSLKNGKVLANIVIESGEGGNKKRRSEKVLLDISANSDYVTNLIKNGIASSIINGTPDQLSNLYTLYGIHIAKQSGNYRDLNALIGISQSKGEHRPNTSQINIGGVDFTIEAFGQKPYRSFGVKTGGVTTGIEQEASGSGNLNEDQVWNFIGQMILNQQNRNIRNPSTPGGGTLPLAQGESFIPR